MSWKIHGRCTINISKDSITAQLNKILASKHFTNSEQLSQFLRFVVSETLNGQSKRIKQYTIAVEALGYEADFDPLTNPSVRVHARHLRRVIEQYYYTQGSEDLIRIDIPKGRYLPVFTKNNMTAKPVTSSDYRSSALGLTEIDLAKPSIAVMMFSCLDPGGEFDYLSTGLTEEIIVALTRFPDFIVLGPLMKEHLSGKMQDVFSLGQFYRVRFILDGTLIQKDDTFRLSVRLTDSRNGQQLWGQMFDCKIQNGSMLAQEDRIIAQVVANVADSYGVIPRTLLHESSAGKKNDNPDTYQAILLYYHYFRTLTPESYIAAITALEKAVIQNPNHAFIAAALGDLLAITYQFGYDEGQANLERAEKMAFQSIALAPNCQAARFTKALIHFLKFERRLFLEEAEQVIKLNPNNAHYIAAISLHLGMVGEWEYSLKLMEKSMFLNPHFPGWYHLLGFMFDYRRNEYTHALNQAYRFNTPGIFWDPLIRAATLGQLEHKAEAEKSVDELLSLVPDFKLRGPNLIRRLVFLDENLNSLLDGLRKAGMDLS